MFSGQGHARIARVAQVVDVRARHLARERDAADGVHVRALLRGADRGHGQGARAVGLRDARVDVFGGDAGHGARGGEEHDVGAGLDKGVHVGGRDDVLAGLGQDARGVHLAGGQHDPVAHGRLERRKRVRDGLGW